MRCPERAEPRIWRRSYRPLVANAGRGDQPRALALRGIAQVEAAGHYRAALPLPRETLGFVAGIIRRHRSAPARGSAHPGEGERPAQDPMPVSFSSAGCPGVASPRGQANGRLA